MFIKDIDKKRLPKPELVEKKMTNEAAREMEENVLVRAMYETFLSDDFELGDKRWGMKQMADNWLKRKGVK